MKNYVIQDDRDAVEKNWTMGLVVATDRFMRGWGNAPGKSYVAMPFFSDEHLRQIETRFNLRPEFLRVHSKQELQTKASQWGPPAYLCSKIVQLSIIARPCAGGGYYNEKTGTIKKAL